MIADQKGKCAICEAELDNGKHTCVDHCHTTGKIRGLLCTRCNWALGGFKDNPVILHSAIKYLQKHTGDANVEKT